MKITITATGTGTLQYSIDGGTTWNTGNVFTNLIAGSYTVKVKDNVDPTISCTSPQIRNTNAGVCTYTVVGTEFNPLAYGDNCPGATLSYSLNEFSNYC